MSKKRKPDFVMPIPIGRQIILEGHDFNMALSEDPETRTLRFSILVKDAQRLERQQMSNQLDFAGDKTFVHCEVKAIGRKHYEG